MTDNRTGRLYSSRGVSHPDALPALADTAAAVDLLAPKRGARAGLSGGLVFGGVFALTVAVALVDALALSGPGLVTTVGFAAIGLVGALLASADGSWAGWTAPPIALLVGLFAVGLATSAAGVIGAALVVLEGLAANMWAVVGVFALTLLIGRRRQLLALGSGRKQRPTEL